MRNIDNIRKLRESFKPCECGCGEQIHEYDNQGRKRRYKRWHNRKGKKFSPEQLMRLSDSHIGSRTGPRKETVGYRALHYRMRQILPKPDFCVVCFVNLPEEVSNISRTYKEDETDWRWLCLSCHRTIDYYQF